MKFNKKITVTALSTVLGLGLVGSISGAVAWYQYSTRATTSIIGTATGNGGTLQISKDGSNWARDLHSSDLKPASGFTGFKPVTFGGFELSNSENSLPEKAHMTPKHGQTATSSWDEATVGVDYIQYTIYLQSLKLNNTSHKYEKHADEVYFTNITLEDVNDTTRENESIINSLRVHILVEDQKTVTASSTTTTTFVKQAVLSVQDFATTGLNTYGSLDLDGDGQPDKKGGYEWEDDYNTVLTYGEDGTSLKSTQASSLVASKDSDGNIASADAAKNFVTTLEDETDATHVLKLTFTIWSEGWAQLDPQADPSTVKAMWDPSKRDGVDFHVGFTFDVGDNAY